MAIWNDFAIYFSPTTTFLLCSNWFISDELKISWPYLLMQSVKFKGKTTPWHYQNHTFFIVLLTTPTIYGRQATHNINSKLLDIPIKKRRKFFDCV